MTQIISPPARAALEAHADEGSDDLESMLDRIVSDAREPRLPQLPSSNATEPPNGRTQSPTVSNLRLLAAENHGKVITAIADDPDLVRFYLSLCQSSGTKRSAPTPSPAECETQRQPCCSPGDFFSVSDSSTRASKFAFHPSSSQQAVNRLLLSSQHEGKATAVIIDSMISSRSTKFKPHPAIIIRVFDIQFGRRGLTIMHFVRFDFAARRAWYADGSVNLNNFSASVALPKAPRPKSLDDISNALTVLHLFVEEFFDQETCRLMSCAREFVEELRPFCQWSPQDVETLVFWFDCVLEDYRAATEHDARHGSSTRVKIKAKMSLQDPDLQSVLYVIQSERLASLMAAPAQRTSHDRPKSRDSYRRIDGARPSRKTPQEVIDALPRQGRQTVCIKYLSASGCASKSDERCMFPYHAHFIPDHLDPIVREHISKNLGGLRPELQQ